MPKRTPPEVIRVIPPELTRRHLLNQWRWMTKIVVIVILAKLALFFGMIWYFGRRDGFSSATIVDQVANDPQIHAAAWLNGGLLVAAIVMLLGVLWALQRAANGERRRQIAAQDLPPNTGIAAEIERLWDPRGYPPKARRVAEYLASRAGTPTAAIIAALSSHPIPQPHDVSFEAEILSPWRRPLLLIPIVLLAYAALLSVAVVGVRADWYLIVVVLSLLLLGAGMLAWMLGLRPRYVRIAPGIVQFLSFSPTRRMPRIRSYPLDAGTIVVAYSKWQFAFVRGKLRNHLTLLFDRHRERLSERIWQALLSTQPIPPLSETELVG